METNQMETNQMETNQMEMDKLKSIYSKIYVIVSPPRCSSTAFSRVLWEHPSVDYYCHEPFEMLYYRNAGLEQAIKHLRSPLKGQNKNDKAEKYAQMNGLVVKAMPYQVADYFPMLVELTSQPLTFLIRDPRLNIASRMAKKVEVGDNPFFPLIETGWELLFKNIKYCRNNEIDYLIVDSSDFRNKPLHIFPQVCTRLKLDFYPSMLNWSSLPGVDIDNFGGLHRHLYKKVLTSHKLMPATEAIPELEEFPLQNGMRHHVANCLEIYHSLRLDPKRIRIPR